MISPGDRIFSHFKGQNLKKDGCSPPFSLHRPLRHLKAQPSQKPQAEARKVERWVTGPLNALEQLLGPVPLRNNLLRKQPPGLLNHSVEFSVHHSQIHSCLLQSLISQTFLFQFINDQPYRNAQVFTEIRFTEGCTFPECSGSWENSAHAQEPEAITLTPFHPPRTLRSPSQASLTAVLAFYYQPIYPLMDLYT